MPGFLAGVFVERDEDLGTVVMCNATSGLDPTLAGELREIVRQAEPHVAEAWRPIAHLDPALLDLVGPWYWGTYGYGLRLRADGLLDLVGLMGSGRASRFRPRGDGTWLGLDGYHAGEVLRPVRRDDRLVALDLGSFLFSRTPYDEAAPQPGGVDSGGWQGGSRRPLGEQAPRMEYRTLGGSGCSVSTLTLGTMTFGNETDEAGAHAQLDRFVEAGGKFIDTADVYTARRLRGDHRPLAAARPGRARPAGHRHQGPLPHGRRTRTDVGLSRRHLSPRARRLACAGSASRHIDLYQVHAWDPLTPIEETLRSSTTPCAPARSVTSGCRTSSAGSCRRPCDHRPVPRLAAAGHPAAAVQPARPRDRVGDRRPLCRNGLGLLPWSPLGGGWLTGKYTRDERPPARPVSARTRAAAWRPTTRAAPTSAPGTSSTPCAAVAEDAACRCRRWRSRGSPTAGRHLGDPRRPHRRAARTTSAPPACTSPRTRRAARQGQRPGLPRTIPTAAPARSSAAAHSTVVAERRLVRPPAV